VPNTHPPQPTLPRSYFAGNSDPGNNLKQVIAPRTVTWWGLKTAWPMFTKIEVMDWVIK